MKPVRGISQFVVRVVELLEAEGRAARRAVYHLAGSIAMMLAAVALILAAAGFLVTGLYFALTPALDPAAAFAVCGGLLLAGAVVCVFIGRDMGRRE